MAPPPARGAPPHWLPGASRSPQAGARAAVRTLGRPGAPCRRRAADRGAGKAELSRPEKKVFHRFKQFNLGGLGRAVVALDRPLHRAFPALPKSHRRKTDARE